MAMTSQELRQSLLARDSEFRRLAEEHSRCESQLEAILEEPYVNSDDLIQETVLKKLKLWVKDQMEMIVARHRRDSVLH
ncbi:MAG TPA: YdcH family protein [Candidatus Acidoferrales bacterium]|nr:YdcH family protein [Candidatus Acidoferrales bacterium]